MKKSNLIFSRVNGAFALIMATTLTTLAQSNNGVAKGAQVIETATEDLKGYFEPVQYLLYAVAAIVGLVGGFRVYQKWQAGEQNVQQHAMGWFGAMLFLLAIGAVISAFFFN